MPKSIRRQKENGAQQNIATAPAQTVGALKLRPAAAYLGGLSVPTMHRLVKRGLLRPNKSTRHLLFPLAELNRFLTDGQT